MLKSSGRIKKLKNPLKKNLTDNTYRQAKPFLERETGGRCCYSMIHKDNAGGDRTMDVEHIKPRKRFKVKPHRYSNLLYCSRHCNSMKGEKWPTKKDLKKGFRFLNPAVEQDYNVHILEDKDTGILVGTTPAGQYHIENCDLNADHLIKARKGRTEMIELLECKNVRIICDDDKKPDMMELIKKVKQNLEKSIPQIAYLAEDKRYMIYDYI